MGTRLQKMGVYDRLMAPPNHVEATGSEFPVHLQIGLATRVFYALSCVVAFLLLGVQVVEIASWPIRLTWHTLLAIPAGMAVADFLSGLIHWSADTWGSESMPILGKRLLHPFRVHHVNPGDFLRRQFIDTNGDVAFLAIPVLLAARQIPLNSSWSHSAALFVVSFASIGLMTNQIHQWAHLERAPCPIRWLQRLGIILGHAAHEQHHQPPYVQNYCIATGWCNRPLQAVQFFSRLERLITWGTGLQPRYDERAFCEGLQTERPAP